MISPSDFFYELPKTLIAQVPASPRDSARLMVLNRQTNQISHHIFSELSDILTNRDVLVLNDTKVFPARLIGKKQSGGVVEILLLEPKGNDTWEAMARGIKTAQIVFFDGGLTGHIIGKNHQTGYITIRLEASENISIDDIINSVGVTPIPPYIDSPLSEFTLRTEYQTVYAKHRGSAAAPTAGLHFTPKLLASLVSKGVQIERVTLHVGPGTFAKLSQSQIDTKTLHHEWFSISSETKDRLTQAKASGKRIIAVGTTSCRALESDTSPTTLFIQPGYTFKFVDALITNFHLPESSLLMLVSAFAGSELIRNAYTQAVENKYRFFSFGDAMFIS